MLTPELFAAVATCLSKNLEPPALGSAIAAGTHAGETALPASRPTCRMPIRVMAAVMAGAMVFDMAGAAFAGYPYIPPKFQGEWCVVEVQRDGLINFRPCKTGTPESRAEAFEIVVNEDNMIVKRKKDDEGTPVADIVGRVIYSAPDFDRRNDPDNWLARFDFGGKNPVPFSNYAKGKVLIRFMRFRNQYAAMAVQDITNSRLGDTFIRGDRSDKNIENIYREPPVAR